MGKHLIEVINKTRITTSLCQRESSKKWASFTRITRKKGLKLAH